jgi:hypothetical protein
MEREEWLTRCAARYEACSGLTKEQARDCAEIALDEEISAGTGLNADPEASADADLECWGNDE